MALDGWRVLCNLCIPSFRCHMFGDTHTRVDLVQSFEVRPTPELGLFMLLSCLVCMSASHFDGGFAMTHSGCPSRHMFLSYYNLYSPVIGQQQALTEVTPSQKFVLQTWTLIWRSRVPASCATHSTDVSSSHQDPMRYLLLLRCLRRSRGTSTAA